METAMRGDTFFLGLVIMLIVAATIGYIANSNSTSTHRVCGIAIPTACADE